MPLSRCLLITVGAVALAVALAPNATARDPAPGLHASVMPNQSLSIAIRPAIGAQHGEHVTPLHLAVEPGLPVHITFTNYTNAFHTFTAQALGITALIRPAHGSTPTKTTITFTAHSYGVFNWICLLCPGPGDQKGVLMRGKIYAIVQV